MGCEPSPITCVARKKKKNDLFFVLARKIKNTEYLLLEELNKNTYLLINEIEAKTPNMIRFTIMLSS